jgi:hypothetical protein
MFEGEWEMGKRQDAKNTKFWSVDFRLSLLRLAPG